MSILYKSVEKAIEKHNLHPPYDCHYYWEDGIGNENCRHQGSECWYGVWANGCEIYNEMFSIHISEDEFD